ncbi:hypothetical protein [Cohaesibacter haloalkalitolerans]|uniref:hypothetical protein n=1 Tax=Cohaesibacter haloalkalitolerans TaxID=1162980 RepID=UPI0013C44BA5|nr:hypothetical protein [Cohaesibacter haloalkalitolerans]
MAFTTVRTSSAWRGQLPDWTFREGTVGGDCFSYLNVMCHSNEIESERREFRENPLSSVISAFFQECGFMDDAQLIKNSHIEHEGSVTGKPALMPSTIPYERRKPLLRKPQALSAKSRHSII